MVLPSGTGATSMVGHVASGPMLMKPSSSSTTCQPRTAHQKSATTRGEPRRWLWQLSGWSSTIFHRTWHAPAARLHLRRLVPTRRVQPLSARPKGSTVSAPARRSARPGDREGPAAVGEVIDQQHGASILRRQASPPSGTWNWSQTSASRKALLPPGPLRGPPCGTASSPRYGNWPMSEEAAGQRLRPAAAPPRRHVHDGHRRCAQPHWARTCTQALSMPAAPPGPDRLPKTSRSCRPSPSPSGGPAPGRSVSLGRRSCP